MQSLAGEENTKLNPEERLAGLKRKCEEHQTKITPTKNYAVIEERTAEGEMKIVKEAPFSRKRQGGDSWSGYLDAYYPGLRTKVSNPLYVLKKAIAKRCFVLTDSPSL